MTRAARPAELTEAGALGPLLTLPPPCVMWGEPFPAWASVSPQNPGSLSEPQLYLRGGLAFWG